MGSRARRHPPKRTDVLVKVREGGTLRCRCSDLSRPPGDLGPSIPPPHLAVGDHGVQRDVPRLGGEGGPSREAKEAAAAKAAPRCPREEAVVVPGPAPQPPAAPVP